jgi:hypothetical protein
MKSSVIKTGSSTIYPQCRVKDNGDGIVFINALVKLPKVNPKDKLEERKFERRKYKMNADEFYKFIPRGITKINPEQDLFVAFSEPRGDATKERLLVEKLFLVRPWNGQYIWKVRGFARRDGLLYNRKSFNDPRILQASLEFAISVGEWAGAIAPFDWPLNDDRTGYEPFASIVISDGERELKRPYRKYVEAILKETGALEYDCSLAETSDPEIVLDYLEQCMKQTNSEFTISLKDGYLDMSTFETFAKADDFADDETEPEAEQVQGDDFDE